MQCAFFFLDGTGYWSKDLRVLGAQFRTAILKVQSFCAWTKLIPFLFWIFLSGPPVLLQSDSYVLFLKQNKKNAWVFILLAYSTFSFLVENFLNEDIYLALIVFFSSKFLV